MGVSQFASAIEGTIFRNARRLTLTDPMPQEYGTGSRQDFLSKLKGGEYNDVVAIYRSNDSTKVTGPFDNELVSSLPASLKYITHNGAGYDNIDIPACSERDIGVSSTPLAVNDSTADSMPFASLCTSSPTD